VYFFKVFWSSRELGEQYEAGHGDRIKRDRVARDMEHADGGCVCACVRACVREIFS
jgi:hypothetical protein